MSKVREYRLIKESLLKQKKEGKKLDKKLYERYKALKTEFLIKEIERNTGMKALLTEGVFTGMPKTIIDNITRAGGGENSVEDKLSITLANYKKVSEALKNPDIIAVW